MKLSRVCFAIEIGIGISFFSVMLPLRALASNPGTEGAAFLNIPVGAGPAALGGAYSALATDAYATLWNPAGLGFVKGTQVSAQHLSYLESIHYEELSFAMPFKTDSGLGFSAQYLGSGDITGRDDQGTSTGEFSSHYAAYGIGYGHSFNPELSFGVVARMIDAKLSDVSGHAYSMDAGALYKPQEKLTLAAVLAEAGSELKFLSSSNPLPLQMRLGLAYEASTRWTISAETAYHPHTQLASGRVGVQWRPLQMIAIRAGYKTDSTQEQGGIHGFTAGMGIDLWGQELAYAWVPYGELGNTQYFSLLLRFGAQEESRKNLIQYQQIKSHRAVRKNKSDESEEPDIQQLMRLSDENATEKAAQSPKSIKSTGAAR